MTFLPFDAGSGGYRWWYVDAISDDRERALVAIFFIGSVFSPHYARSRRKTSVARPEDHVAVNLALYERGKAHTWVFSEYGARALSLGGDEVRIGESSFAKKDGGAGEIRIVDQTVATRRAVRGSISFSPEEGPLTGDYVNLAPRHEWRAHVPRARVRVSFDSFQFEGTGYHDENRGTEPLDRAFASWSWGRFHQEDATRVFFDMEKKSPRLERSLLSIETGHPPLIERLPRRRMRGRLSSWLAPLPEDYESGARADGSRRHVAIRTLLEPAPFYARFLGSSAAEASGVETIGMVEHISFDRTTHPIVERMIGLRLARPEKGSYGWIP